MGIVIADMGSTLVDAVPVVADVNAGVEVESRAALEAGDVDASPFAGGVG
jgi:hypothetical protein